MDKSETQTTLGIRHRTMTYHRKSTFEKSKSMRNTDHTKSPNFNPSAHERKTSILFLIRHPSCYSYSQVVKDIAMHKKTNNTNKTPALLH
jgi:hypothetical protein